jgi:hypothetical protein
LIDAQIHCGESLWRGRGLQAPLSQDRGRGANRG